MRHFFCVFVAVLFAAAVHAGVRRLKPGGEHDRSGRIDPADSAALFVGVRAFTYDETLTEVRYAVDDAVDLAFALALDGKPRLVEPQRVVLALSGDPQKAQSRQNLAALVAAGASVHGAAQSDVLVLLERQARAVASNGILIVAFSTHGVSDEGTQYLLAATSLLQHRETSVSEAKVRDIVARAHVPRSLILLDACRERLTRSARTGDPDPRSAAALLRALAAVNGVAVLSAASAGDYAYDDDVRRNGVFTAAVIDGLRCGAPTDRRGFVTVDTLSDYVEEQVLAWVRKHRDPEAKKATQLQYEGRSKTMPLSVCITGMASTFAPAQP